MTEREIVGIAEAARRLGVHQNTLRKWADEGIIPTLRLPSGYRRFTVADLEAFRESMRRPPADRRQKAPARDEPGRGETPDTGCSR